jgi:hypothetical protein
MKKARMDTQTILVFVVVSILAVLLALRQTSKMGSRQKDNAHEKVGLGRGFSQ